MLARLTAALADRYAVERELGRGGMAVVFLARDLRHERPVAIKVMGTDWSAQLGADRFLREIKTAALLNHPNVLPLYDSGSADGLLYYVMPYIEGGSLRDRLAREGQLPLEEAVGITREVADALAHAHSHGVVHRDIKPENILFMAGRPVVADFGIARAVSAAGGEALTQTGMAIGTPAYMSPEQAVGDTQIDGRSDVYALGCVLYEMLAGRPPFLGASSREVIARHAIDPPPPLRSARPSVSPAIEQVVLRTLAKVPADRFATAHDLRQALATGTTGDQPVAAVVRRVFSRRGALAAAVVAAVALGIWGVAATRTAGATMAVTVTDAEGNTVERIMPRPEFRKRLALFYFDAEPADTMAALLAYGLTDGLGMMLLQDPFFDVRAPGYFRERLARRGYPSLAGVPVALAREIAEEQFREQFVTGRLRTEGDGLVLDYAVHATATGAAVRSGTLRASDPLALVDLLSQSVRGTVELPEGHEGQVSDLPAAELLTASPAAFAEYARGMRALLVRGDWDAAAAAFTAAGAADPTFALAHYLQYTVRLFQGRPQDGLAALEAALDHAYRLPERVQNQARSNWYEMTGDQARAYAVIEMNAELFPDDVTALMALAQTQGLRNQRREAIATYERILALDPGQQDFLRAVGQMHQTLGEYDQALAAFQRYTEANPEDPRGFVDIGDAQRTRGNLDAAREAYERALLLEGGNLTTRLRIADLLLARGEFAAARDDYDAILRSARGPEDSAAAWRALESWHRARGREREALRIDSLTFAAMARTMPPLQLQLQRLFGLNDYVMVGDTAQALALLDRYAAEMQPPFDAFLPLGQLAVAIALEDPVRIDSAAASLERSIARLGIETFRGNVHYARGQSAYLRGQYQEALTHWNAERAANPGDYTVLRQLAQAYRGLGDHRRAETLLTEALRIRPADPRTKYELALLYQAQGRRDRARAAVHEALAVWVDADPGHRWAGRARALLAELGG